jgi:hypothetical protein
MRLDIERNLDKAMKWSHAVAHLPLGHQCLKDVLVARIVSDDHGAMRITLRMEPVHEVIKPAE